MDITGKVINAMIEYNEGDLSRINHFLKVFGYAKAIGELEGLDGMTQEILEIAALTHDIGIRNSERKYGSSDGTHQQIEGPPEAMAMLTGLHFEPKLIDRVYWLIAHHHIYTDIIGIDYQILVEADFLVNAFEGGLPLDIIVKTRDEIFTTNTGIAFLNKMFIK